MPMTEEEIKALQEENARLKAETEANARTSRIATIRNNLAADDVKATGLKTFGMFSNQYHDRLNGKTGATLVQEVNAIKSEITSNKDQEALETFFGGAVEVNASGALERVAKLGENTKTTSKENIKDLFYPGTTIRKK